MASQKKKKSFNPDKNPNPILGVLIIIFSLAIIYGIFATILIMPKSSIEEGEIATQTIKAPRDVVDSHTTNINKQEARNQVGAIYRQDSEITTQVTTQLHDALDSIDVVRVLGENEYNRMKDVGEDIKFTVTFYEECLMELPEGFITGDVMGILQITDEEEYIRLKEVVTGLVQTEMESGVIESSLDARKTDLKNQLILSAFDNEVRKLGSTLIDIYLKANMIYDATATEAAKDEAEKQVTPITFKEGEIIIYEGVAVTKAQLETLKSLGLIKDETIGVIEYLSVGVLLLILFLIVVIYLQSFHKEIAYENKMLAVVMFSIIATLLFTWITTSFINKYFIPIAYAPLMLVMLMIDKKAAIFVNSLLALLVGIMATRLGDSILLPIVTAAFVAGTVSVYAIRNASNRSSLMYAGIASGLAMGLVYVSFDMINHMDYIVMIKHFAWGIASGGAVAIITIGTLPLVEGIYKMVTPMKLMELTNPNQPLLKKLLIEAPGTYHHSIMVGNMAERAADAIGANALIVRSAAYYHDIGKIKRPYFFIENHIDSRNPHDNIDSQASVSVIRSHVSDGLDMLKKAKIPVVIQDIVAQHHGDTAVMYFYLKDKKESNYPENIKIDNYRYNGERPKTREAGIIMLADSCEAAIKSIESSTRENVKEKIDTVVKGKLDDGQLDYCDITLKEISIIKEEFLVALTGVFHERIEYPDKKREE